MEPETLIHHLVSPICVLCSTQTDVDFRVLCQLCICIDASGAILGMSKFLLRFSHLSASNIYQQPVCSLKIHWKLLLHLQYDILTMCSSRLHGAKALVVGVLDPQSHIACGRSWLSHLTSRLRAACAVSIKDTVIIVWRELSVKGGFFSRMKLIRTEKTSLTLDAERRTC